MTLPLLIIVILALLLWTFLPDWDREPQSVDLSETSQE